MTGDDTIGLVLFIFFASWVWFDRKTPWRNTYRSWSRDSDRSGEAVETAKTGSTEGESAGPRGHRP